MDERKSIKTIGILAIVCGIVGAAFVVAASFEIISWCYSSIAWIVGYAFWAFVSLLWGNLCSKMLH